MDIQEGMTQKRYMGIYNRSKYRMYISSEQQLNENSIKFSLLTQT